MTVVNVSKALVNLGNGSVETFTIGVDDYASLLKNGKGLLDICVDAHVIRTTGYVASFLGSRVCLSRDVPPGYVVVDEGTSSEAFCIACAERGRKSAVDGWTCLNPACVVDAVHGS